MLNLAALADQFLLQDSASILAFVTRHRQIPRILLEAVPHLRQDFGAGTAFAPRVPMDEDGDGTLYAVAMWTGSASGAMNALDKFDDSWWLNHSKPAPGYMNFTYEL